MSHPTSLTQPDTLWRILRNHEGRYSVHPAAYDIPAGWTPAGSPDTRAACLAGIARLWTDMRPDALTTALQTAGTEGTA